MQPNLGIVACDGLPLLLLLVELAAAVCLVVPVISVVMYHIAVPRVIRQSQQYNRRCCCDRICQQQKLTDSQTKLHIQTTCQPFQILEEE